MGLAGGHVAQPYRGVCAGGGQQLSVGAERHAEHRVGVALRPSARLSIHAVDKLVGLRLAGAVHAVKPAMSGHRRPVARRPVLRKAVRRYGHNDAPPRTSKASRERGHGRRGSQASHGLKRPGVLSSTGHVEPGRRRAPRSAEAGRGALQRCCAGQAMERTLDRSAPDCLFAAASVSTMARRNNPPCSLISREASVPR
jgi:hypothetical protein